MIGPIGQGWYYFDGWVRSTWGGGAPWERVAERGPEYLWDRDASSIESWMVGYYGRGVLVRSMRYDPVARQWGLVRSYDNGNK